MKYSLKKNENIVQNDYHIDKNALKQMSLNFKNLHDDLMQIKFVTPSAAAVATATTTTKKR